MSKIRLGILLLGLLGGCSRSETPAPDSGNEIQITSRVLTRAGMEQGFHAGDRIGLYMTAEAFRSSGFDRSEDSWLNNHPFMLHADDLWKAPYVAQWEKSDVVADAVGYFPYDAENDQETDLKALPCRVSTDQRSLDSLRFSDFLWARAEEVTPQDGALSLAFRHCMSKVIFRLQFTSDDPLLDMSQVKVTWSDVYTDATVDVNTGALTLNTGNLYEVNAYYDPSTRQAECMLPPQVIRAGTDSQVRFFVGDNQHYRGFTYEFGENLTLSSGKEYLIDIVYHL